jgi:prepilin-type processing-associated H-X9-DG protein
MRQLKPRVAVSITELIVVLAVIGLLTAIIVPIVVASRRRASGAACQAHVRQWSLALSLYTLDWDSSYPAASQGAFSHSETTDETTWIKLVVPYVPRGLVPSCPSIRTPGRLQRYRGSTAAIGYAYNARLNYVVGSADRHRLSGRHEAVIQFPALTVTLLDARVGMIATRSPDVGITANELHGLYAVDFTPELLAQPEGGRRHEGSAMYSFADGHVKQLLPTAFSTSSASISRLPTFFP